jgi:hypothetical protein
MWLGIQFPLKKMIPEKVSTLMDHPTESRLSDGERDINPFET